jgi:hypothetical protein
MGGAVIVLFTLSLLIAILLLFQRFADPAWAWTLRLGLLISLAGMLAALPMLTLKAHTVGAADGGPGIPVLGWSSVAGDLRIPHFVGLHGLQALLLLGWLITTRLPWLTSAQRVALVWVSALSYLALVALLEWQALRGQAVMHPDGATWLAVSAWLLGSGIGAGALLWQGRFQRLSARIARG